MYVGHRPGGKFGKLESLESTRTLESLVATRWQRTSHQHQHHYDGLLTVSGLRCFGSWEVLCGVDWILTPGWFIWKKVPLINIFFLQFCLTQKGVLQRWPHPDFCKDVPALQPWKCLLPGKQAVEVEARKMRTCTLYKVQTLCLASPPALCRRLRSSHRSPSMVQINWTQHRPQHWGGMCTVSKCGSAGCNASVQLRPGSRLAMDRYTQADHHTDRVATDAKIEESANWCK